MSNLDHGRVAAEKRELRQRLLAARRQRPLPELIESAGAVAGNVLRQPEIATARIVAAYVSVGTEPGTGPLLDALAERGVRVLLPVVRPDLDLDWAPYAGAELLVSARLGMLQPTTALLGPDAVSSADVVLCPGLAVDGRGNRLGRGGGSYDRALHRLPNESPRWVLLYEDERLARVPVDAHDVPVDAVVTPTGVHRLPALQVPPPAPGLPGQSEL